jgi:hypothetical protein
MYALDAERIPLGILSTDSFIVSALIHQGVIPCSPIPTTTITMEALNFYWIAHYCNPHFSIQAYMRMLCDLQGVYTSYFSHI